MSWKEVVVRHRRRRDLESEDKVYKSVTERYDEIPKKTTSGNVQSRSSDDLG